LQLLFGLLIQVCPAKRLQNLTKNPAKSNPLDFADRFYQRKSPTKSNRLLFDVSKLRLADFQALKALFLDSFQIDNIFYVYFDLLFKLL